MARHHAAPHSTGSPARPRNVRGEGERLREQLVAATVTLLDREGDASKVSVRAIARMAGVSPTALYLHFPDRDALVSAAVDRGFTAFNTAILTAAAGRTEPRARVRAMGLAYLDFAARQPAMYAVLFSTRRPAGRPASVPAGDPARVERDEALDGLITVVAEAAPGVDRGEARDLALTLWAGLHGYAALRARTKVRAWPEAAPYADRLLDALLGV